MYKFFLIWAMWLLTVMVMAMIEATVLLKVLLWLPVGLAIIAIVVLAIRGLDTFF